MRTIILTLILTVLATPAFAEQSVFDRVMESKTLKCGYFIEPPLTQMNLETNQLEGIVVDLTESLANDMGLKVEWTEEINASTMIAGLDNNRYDALCASIWNLTSRSHLIEHSVPYLYTPIGVFVRSDDTRFDDGYRQAINTKDVKIAGIDGDGGFIVASKFFPDAETVLLPQFSSHSEMFLNVAGKKADVAFAILPIYLEYNEKNPDKVKNVATENTFNVLGNSFAFKQGELEIKNAFDNAIMTYVNSGELDVIIDKWEKYPSSFYRVTKPYQIGK